MNRINQPIKIFCPICGTALERPEKETHTRNPNPGDVSICRECGELSEFDSTLNLVKITDEEKLKEIMSSDEIRFTCESIKAAHDPVKAKAYEDQLDKMKAQVLAWRKDNPDSVISIQYNFQEKVCVVGCLEDGIKKGFVSANDGAMNMFRELGWLDGKNDDPTILMVRMVMDAAFGG